MKLLTVAQAAKRLGISRQRVLVLIRDRRITATRVGRAWLVDAKDCRYSRLRPWARRVRSD